MFTRSVLKTVAEKIPGETVDLFSNLARQNQAAILLGSIYELSRDQKKVYNTSVLINKAGRVLAKYRKKNLFHAQIGSVAVRESDLFTPGTRLASATLAGMTIGLSVCYDVRFPKMYGQYAKKGCSVLTIPASFTQKTGQAHWEVLLRARAIENFCYVLAPNQVGKDGQGVESYGNSMIISPWGEILARASGNKQEIIYAQIHQKTVRQAQEVLPKGH